MGVTGTIENKIIGLRQGRGGWVGLVPRAGMLFERISFSGGKTDILTHFWAFKSLALGFKYVIICSIYFIALNFNFMQFRLQNPAYIWLKTAILNVRRMWFTKLSFIK